MQADWAIFETIPWQFSCWYP